MWTFWLRTKRGNLGCEIEFEVEPLAVRNVLRGDNNLQTHPKERGHNVAILYRCHLPDGYCIDNGDKTSDENGYLQWFDELPHDFMKIQSVYDDILRPWRREK